MERSNFNVKFMFGLDGKIKFENNSKNEYDIMVHYTDEKNIPRTLYLHKDGRKFAREISKNVIFENEFVFKNEFTGNSFDVPIFCLTIYPIENREYSKKPKSEQKKWNETKIKNLNNEFRECYSALEYKNYEDYYYELDQEKKRTTIVIPKQEGNFWKDKTDFLLNVKEEKIENNTVLEKEYKGIGKLERTKKLIEEIEKLKNLKIKLSYANIKFEFEFESEFLNFNSKIDD